jgi:hypothetical protein
MIKLPKLINPNENFDNKQDIENFPLEVFPTEVTNYIYELRDKMGCNPNLWVLLFFRLFNVNRSIKGDSVEKFMAEWCMLWNVQL